MSKGIHISSFANGLSSAKAKNRGFDCSCSAESTPAGDNNTELSGESTPAVHENTELLDFLFFKPEPYSLPRWNLKVYFTAFCYGAYTIHSKMLLNSFPCPWLLSTAYVALGFLTFAYFSGDLPIDSGFWKSLFPVAVAHTIGLAAEMVSLSKLPADSTHIIRCAEPVFTVLLSMLFGGQSFPLPVYLSLLPIVAGCALAVFSDLNFNMIGFITAMIANLGFAFTNFLAGKGMNEKERAKVTPLQYYGSLSLLSFLILAPFSFVIEGPQRWAAGWKMAALKDGADAIVMLIGSIGMHYYFYNEEVYRFFPTIQAFPFLTVNTAKKIFVIFSSIIFLCTPVQTTSLIGAIIVIYGIFLYSREMCKISRIQTWYL